jgi:hypothetical protein
MKRDRVLTMDECLNEWGTIRMHVDPPGHDARHVPIAGFGTSVRGCNCDRWGHPRPNCVEPKIKPPLELPTSLPAKQLT